MAYMQDVRSQKPYFLLGPAVSAKDCSHFSRMLYQFGTDINPCSAASTFVSLFSIGVNSVTLISY